jgi:hypothetical protein
VSHLPARRGHDTDTQRRQSDCRARELNPHWILAALALPQQLRQPRDVDGDPPRFVRRQHLGLHGLHQRRPVACPLASRTT